MNIDEVLEIDRSDPDQRLADELVHEDDQLLAELIRIRRETMTQQDVADRLGISRPAVAAFERYDADPRLSTVRRYALAIRAHVEHVVTPDAERQVNQTPLLWAHLRATCDWQPQVPLAVSSQWSRIRFPLLIDAVADIMEDDDEADFKANVFRGHDLFRRQVRRAEASAET